MVKRDDLLAWKYMFVGIIFSTLFLIQAVFFDKFDWWFLVLGLFFDLCGYLKADK